MLSTLWNWTNNESLSIIDHEYSFREKKPHHLVCSTAHFRLHNNKEITFSQSLLWQLTYAAVGIKTIGRDAIICECLSTNSDSCLLQWRIHNGLFIAHLTYAVENKYGRSQQHCVSLVDCRWTANGHHWSSACVNINKQWWSLSFSWRKGKFRNFIFGRYFSRF